MNQADGQISLFQKQPVSTFPCGCEKRFRWDGKFASAQCKHGWVAFYPHSMIGSEEEFRRKVKEEDRGKV